MIPRLSKRIASLDDLRLRLAMAARKHRRLAIRLMVVSALCGLAWCVLGRPVYYSKAIVRPGGLAPAMDADGDFQEGRIQRIVKELQEPHIVERTARRLGMKGAARDIRKQYVFKTAARPNPDGNIEIEVWPVSPELARRWAPALVQEFEADRNEKHSRDTRNIIDTYAREIHEIAAGLGETLGEKFEIENPADVTRAMIELEKRRGASAGIAPMEKRIGDMGRILIRLADPSLDVIARLSLLSSLDPDPQPAATWRQFEKERGQIARQIAEAGAANLPGGRLTRELDGRLETLDRKLAAEYQAVKDRFDLEYQELIEKKSALAAKPGAGASATGSGREFSRLPRERMAAEMKHKLEALESAWKQDRVDLTFIRFLDLPGLPVSPNPGKIAIVTLLAGALLSLGIPLLIESLDRTLSNPGQVESALHLRSLGIVPKADDSPGAELIGRGETGESSLSKAFRVIRTHLLPTDAASKAPQVTMVTSAMRREGKTLVCSNLAISFAHAGEKTLIIDADFRRGRMHRLFGCRASPGLSSVLLGEATLDDACRPAGHENLFVVSAGRRFVSGAELLGSPKFDELMRTLRERFDRIVVDAPPVLGLSETSILQKHVDGVLLVIRNGRTPIRNVQAAIEMLKVNGASFRGFVLNRLDPGATENHRDPPDSRSGDPPQAQNA